MPSVMTSKCICIFVTNDVTHDSRVLRTASYFASKGHTVEIIGLTSKREALTDESIDRNTHIHRVPRYDQPTTESKNIFKIAKYYLPLLYTGTENTRRMLQYARTLQPKIVYANDLDTLLLAYRFARASRVPLILDAHEILTETISQSKLPSYISWAFKKYYTYIEKRYLPKTQLLVTVCNSIADYYHNKYPGLAIQVIKNVPSKSLVPKKTENLHALFKIPNNTKIVLYQGKFLPGRGILQLIDAIRLLPQQYVLCLIGEGSMENEMKKRIDLLQITSRVFFTGQLPIEKLLSYTAGASLGTVLIEDINLSKRFALPNKLFEYMAAGIPILGSSLPEIKRVILDNACGQVIDKLDPQTIGNAIENILNSTNLFRLGKNGQIAFQTTYNWDLESVKLQSVIDTYTKFE
ncbi:MAG: glycosyltransferase family 4 protein [Candidatus Kerfeldbacteria bacterium]|nr:glycosyltransferase family 4 protein [Candidatus Kerfeldbacteria bacterium]